MKMKLDGGASCCFTSAVATAPSRRALLDLKRVAALRVADAEQMRDKAGWPALADSWRRDLQRVNEALEAYGK